MLTCGGGLPVVLVCGSNACTPLDLGLSALRCKAWRGPGMRVKDER